MAQRLPCPYFTHHLVLSPFTMSSSKPLHKVTIDLVSSLHPWILKHCSLQILFFLLSFTSSSSSTCIFRCIQNSPKCYPLFFLLTLLFDESLLWLSYWLHPLLWLFGFLEAKHSSLLGKSLILCMCFVGSAYQNIQVERQFFLSLISEEIRGWAHAFIFANQMLLPREWTATRGHLEFSFIHVAAAVDGPGLSEGLFWPLHWKLQLLSPQGTLYPPSLFYFLPPDIFLDLINWFVYDLGAPFECKLHEGGGIDSSLLCPQCSEVPGMEYALNDSLFNEYTYG